MDAIQYREMNQTKSARGFFEDQAGSPFGMDGNSDESPPSGPYSGSDEELFHLELSDEGSGGKRSKLDHDHLAKVEAFGHLAEPPKKRGAVQPLANSASDLSSKKARKMGNQKSSGALIKSNKCREKSFPMDLIHEFKLQPINLINEEEDSDPHMSRAAIYYLLAQEDQLTSKHYYDGKNRINPKSVTITIKSREKLLHWLFLVNQQFAYEFDTWVLTASILDRFLSAQPIDKDIFQLSGCAAFLLAAKHEERDPPKITELVNLCAHCYMKTDFIKMERIMLRVLEWNLLSPNVNILLREVCLAQNINLSSDFIIPMLKMIIIHKSLAYMPPSKLAFSLISVVDQYNKVEDVEKTFKYLLYLLKQDPLDPLFDDEP